MKTYLHNLVRKSIGTFWSLAKVMVPIMILVRIADNYGMVDAMGPFLEPIMSLIGLPAEAGIVWATSLFIGIYAGFGAMPVLAGVDMNVAQASILATIMLIAHALPVEQAIVRQTGVSFFGTMCLRFFGAVLYGLIVHWVCTWLGLLQDPADLSLLTASGNAGQTNFEFAIAMAKSLGMVFIIIIVLFVLLDISDHVGLTDKFTELMIPLIRLSGLNKEIAPLTTIGVLLGLTYGGGLIIAESKEKGFSLRAKTLALCWLSLTHAVLEDTFLMLAMDASLWVILVGRVIFTLIVVRIIASLWPRVPEPMPKPDASEVA
ncbi:MAG: hypothetical protein COA52_03860 [Hyphomicrobiales bacterium]|nr:hypothetical protein [Hyphomicrobiales bacterium]PCJ95144.1 MAG: hypothetical protein COA52_03860 [Hyphomicrobiales bacterium]